MEKIRAAANKKASAFALAFFNLAPRIGLTTNQINQSRTAYTVYKENRISLYFIGIRVRCVIVEARGQSHELAEWLQGRNERGIAETFEGAKTAEDIH